jgi:hypothetical protein
MKNSIQKRKWTLLAISLIIPIGFLTKFYTGPAQTWINNSLGGIFYVIFWSLLLFLIIPNVQPIKITFFVFIGTCFFEFLQLWHPEILEIIRSNFIGRTILGTSFSFLDFFHYFVGFILSFILLRYLRKIEVEDY